MVDQHDNVDPLVDHFGNAKPEKLTELLQVKDGHFIPKSIVGGDSFTMIPKAFNPTLLAE
jgi:hypothetical protein